MGLIKQVVQSHAYLLTDVKHALLGGHAECLCVGSLDLNEVLLGEGDPETRESRQTNPECLDHSLVRDAAMRAIVVDRKDRSTSYHSMIRRNKSREVTPFGIENL